MECRGRFKEIEVEACLVDLGDLRPTRRLPNQLDELIRIADTFDIPAIKAKLQEIVPEYTPNK